MQVSKNKENDNLFKIGIYKYLERTNSMTKLPPKTVATSGTVGSKDFEYLIRRELDKFDTEHSPSTLQRNSNVQLFIFINKI
jgi:hypothetical protein